MRSCPICNTSYLEADIFQEENIDQTRLSKFSFASRKIPEFMCHRLMRCNSCDLVYVSNPPPKEELANSYHLAEYDSSEEADDAARSYMQALKPVFNKLKRKDRVLEIGSGTGVLLESLQDVGFLSLVGIEPSHAAIAAAPKHRQAWLQEGIFEEKNYEPRSFDLICCFMTMEHVYDPKELAKSAYNLLRPGGIFVTITHDYRSLVNQMMGKKSPIIDIEHMQLFSKRSMKYLFSTIGYVDVNEKDFKNKYSLKYWIRLAPLPKIIKSSIIGLTNICGLGRLKIGFNVGNFITCGIKSD
jgi:2-polyprenyl-3-methyl-5-hydroxy-6-metoxy-1,4-benzoquinol methylase